MLKAFIFKALKALLAMGMPASIVAAISMVCRPSWNPYKWNPMATASNKPVMAVIWDVLFAFIYFTPFTRLFVKRLDSQVQKQF